MEASHTVCVFAVVSDRGITLYHTIGLRKHAKIGFTVEGAYKASIMERESNKQKVAALASTPTYRHVDYCFVGTFFLSCV